MVVLKQLAAPDAALLSRIGGASLLESHGHSAPGETMQAYVDKSFSEDACRVELREPTNVFWALFYEGEPAGYFKIIYDTSHSMVPLNPVTKLERIYLLKEFYGLKLGHRLLEKAIALSQAAGDKAMWLDVWKKNDRALRFYEKEGFEPVGESQFAVTETHANPIWVMVRRY
jgi:GNAT superfamily N-acetyltransferase